MAHRLVVTPVMEQVIDHPARFKVVTAGRRFGKDIIGEAWLHWGDLVPDALYWYIAPYRKQAKAIAWPRVKDLARACGVAGRGISESELIVTWPNGAQTQLHGADNPDSLVGVGVKKALFTEHALCRAEVWPQYVRPMLTQTRGEALFVSSPRAQNHHYDLHLRGLDPSEPDWMSWTFKTSDSPFVDPAEVEAARRDMDPWVFRQEYEASFETGGNRACYQFDRSRNVADDVDERAVKAWLFGLDFNVQPMAAILWGQLGPRRVHAFDEIVIPDNAHTQMMCEVVRQRWPQVRDCYPDPTGGARTATGPKTNHQILRDNGYRVIARPGAPDHIDRMAAWNSMLCDGAGEVHATMSGKCRHLIADCERAQRLPDGRIDKVAHDPHSLDAATYAIEYLFPVIRREVVSTSRWG